MDTIFIGYDAREHEAAAVCAFSILKRASRRTQVYMLEHQMLRRMGYFDRPWRIDENGQFTDERDGKPFSTGFSHSRFLVFRLAHDLGLKGPCMFVDCDFLFLDDVSKLLSEQQRRGDKIGVVGKTRAIKETVKMDGMEQSAYQRKLWSAMFTFMPSKELADKFDLKTVNEAAGRDLHGFLKMPKSAFWDIDPSWHFIPSLDAPQAAKAVHYSEWSPWINPERMSDFPAEFTMWHEERVQLIRHAGKTGQFLLCRNLEQDVAVAVDSSH